jgi:hypothetical protein
LTEYRIAIFSFTIISIIGLAIFAIATMQANFIMALAGRAVFGIGAECQGIWFFTIISIWFHYGEISFAVA